MSRYRYLAALLALGGAACGSGDDAAPAASTQTADAPASGDADLTDISEYELTMDKVDRLFAAQRNIAVAIQGMTPAERQTMEQNTEGSGESLDAFARNIESSPKVRAALEEAGMEPREYATATMAMVSAAMAASVLQSRPNDNQDSLAREMHANLDNVRFLQQNEAEITRKQQALEADLREMGAIEE